MRSTLYIGSLDTVFLLKGNKALCRENTALSSQRIISIKTVETHRASLMRKLDLHNASALTAYAMERELVTR